MVLSNGLELQRYCPTLGLQLLFKLRRRAKFSFGATSLQRTLNYQELRLNVLSELDGCRTKIFGLNVIRRWGKAGFCPFVQSSMIGEAKRVLSGYGLEM